MTELDFVTSLVLTMSVAAAFAGAGALTASVFEPRLAVRRMITANVVFCVGLGCRLYMGAAITPIGYALVWSALMAASMFYISSLRWAAGLHNQDRVIAIGVGVGTLALWATAWGTADSQWVGLVASLYSAVPYVMGLRSAREMNTTSLQRPRLMLLVTCALCLFHSAAHVGWRTVDLWLGLDRVQPSALTYVALLWLCLAFNVALMLTLYLRLVGQVASLAEHDELTGVYNRRGLMNRMRSFRASSARPGIGALILIDIDHFKRINDQHGHAVGDQVLRWFADRINSHVGAGESTARLGGEEFCLVLPGRTVPEAGHLAEHLRRELSETWRFAHESGGHRITASFGVAPLSGDADGPVNVDLARADLCLYEAKGAGRNRVVVWEPGLGPATPRVRSIVPSGA